MTPLQVVAEHLMSRLTTLGYHIDKVRNSTNLTGAPLLKTSLTLDVRVAIPHDTWCKVIASTTVTHNNLKTVLYALEIRVDDRTSHNIDLADPDAFDKTINLITAHCSPGHYTELVLWNKEGDW